MATFDQLIDRVDALVQRLENLVPAPAPDTDWQSSAFRWRQRGRARGYLEAVANPHRVSLDSLHNIERQKRAIVGNTRRFASGLPANNVLLTGARGTGKSTLIKACWNAFADQGLKLVQVEKSDLIHLADMVAPLSARPEKFIVFCDDLSFEEGEGDYKALKSALDGSIAAPPDNILFYATSNRRHLLPEQMRENLDVTYEGGEVRPNDSTEEKVSLSDRFGLWLSFYPFSQDDYLAAARYWLETMGGEWSDDVRADALRWAMTRGARSGRVARQFALDFAHR